MANTVNLNIRVDANLKKRAESIFNELGMNLTTAMNLFLRSAVRYGGIPMELRLDSDTYPQTETENGLVSMVAEAENDFVAERTSNLHPRAETKGEFLRRLAQSEADAAAGRTRDAYVALRQVREKHGI